LEKTGAMQKYLFKSIQVVNEGEITTTDVLVENGRIEKISPGISEKGSCRIIDGEGKHLLPGVIDNHVHFREPGLTHKGTLYSESKAAVAGGVTSFMEMPNTIPPVFTRELLEDKYARASQSALANYSFYMGTCNNNADEVLRLNEGKKNVCGIKIFMGSSTGDLLLDNPVTLERLFRESELLIATHCEDERTMRSNLAKLIASGKALTIEDYPVHKDEEACYLSSLAAIQLAKKYDSRLHILHITTEKELQLFSNLMPLAEKRITAEACVHHLHFTSDDYAVLGNKIKCNPPIKDPRHKAALWKAVNDNRIDSIATDHAPHLLAEKNVAFEEAHSGLPLVQHGLQLMLHYCAKGQIAIEQVVEKMCHAVAAGYRVAERGYIREGYHADLVLVNLNHPEKVSQQNVYYHCGWSPLEGMVLPATIEKTFVNGHCVFEKEADGTGRWDESKKGMRLGFDRN
jgi:dihydroorotase